MPNYRNSKIYRICSPNTDLVYYGSTTQPLAKRMGEHRAPSNKCSSDQVIDVGGAYIVLVEDFPCDRKEQLNARERWYIENNECVNKHVPGRTRKEYYAANREKIKDDSNEYYAANREKAKNYASNHYAANREKKRAYYKKNKEKKRAHKAELVMCMCCMVVPRGSMWKHKKSIEHTWYMEQLAAAKALPAK